ncbi:4-hydroxythreonine-4-phosphate dehydrogenase PdxA [Terrarubrum flagellatum]|uniref:4-hydroxythreonine-4-phosphate dehydrogenase PdxA n=1 Tax=Terrirubrum flagellatum TaxID=2895980 RepID=UPI0031455F4C
MALHELPIGVTVGDPAGIGPEITVRLFESGLPHPALAIGDIGALKKAAKILDAKREIIGIAHPREAAAHPRAINVIAASNIGADIAPGKIDARAGRAAYDAIIAGADLALSGALRAIVTAPIHKEALAAAGVSFPGHTELLADRAGVDHVAMMLANDELRVLLVSIHVPLTQAIAMITPENELRAIRFAADACRGFGIAKPRIAVAGLNPHAGEHGLMGEEDDAIIAPAIAQARAEGFDAQGPFPPDTVFMRARKGEFDIVVAQYHDQGLIPVKYLGLDRGVNVTVGLPFVRTSVDHGTAFEIAGKGVADESSLRAAFDLAVAMMRRG